MRMHKNSIPINEKHAINPIMPHNLGALLLGVSRAILAAVSVLRPSGQHTHVFCGFARFSFQLLNSTS